MLPDCVREHMYIQYIENLVVDLRHNRIICVWEGGGVVNYSNNNFEAKNRTKITTYNALHIYP